MMKRKQSVFKEKYTGQVFGRLTVLKEEPRPNKSYGKGFIRWAWVECKCGTPKWVLMKSLKYGDVVSCGCALREARSNWRVSYVGQRFHRLVIQTERANGGNRSYDALALCDCGTQKWIRLDGILSGQVKSCGCYQRDRVRELNTIHGDCVDGGKTAEYITWTSMMQRCYNPKNISYPNYGGRGIQVADRWHMYANFLEDLLATIGRRPGPEFSIDRLDVNGNYEPGNIRWATRTQQAQNTRRMAA